jgi:hypothetical protein
MAEANAKDTMTTPTPTPAPRQGSSQGSPDAPADPNNPGAPAGAQPTPSSGDLTVTAQPTAEAEQKRQAAESRVASEMADKDTPAPMPNRDQADPVVVVGPLAGSATATDLTETDPGGRYKMGDRYVNADGETIKESE